MRPTASANFATHNFICVKLDRELLEKVLMCKASGSKLNAIRLLIWLTESDLTILVRDDGVCGARGDLFSFVNTYTFKITCPSDRFVSFLFVYHPDSKIKIIPRLLAKSI